MNSGVKSSKAPWIILLVFALGMAFLGYEMMQFKRAGKQIHGVDIAIRPAQLTLKPGESHIFEAAVVGSENADVGWGVGEGVAGGVVVSAGVVERGGRVFSAGRYTAPATPGVYHVLASSKADESRTATAVITVTP